MTFFRSLRRDADVHNRNLGVSIDVLELGAMTVLKVIVSHYVDHRERSKLCLPEVASEKGLAVLGNSVSLANMIAETYAGKVSWIAAPDITTPVPLVLQSCDWTLAKYSEIQCTPVVQALEADNDAPHPNYGEVWQYDQGVSGPMVGIVVSDDIQNRTQLELKIVPLYIDGETLDLEDFDYAEPLSSADTGMPGEMHALLTEKSKVSRFSLRGSAPLSVMSADCMSRLSEIYFDLYRRGF